MAIGRDPVEVRLAVTPSSRCELIDVRAAAAAAHGDLFNGFQHSLYCSYHTTAGYLDQGVVRRLRERRADVRSYIRVFQTLFPEAAGYRHDQLPERRDLSPAEREVEPKNADAHLAFIGAGLQSCVRYVNRPNEPVYLVELDGIVDGRVRTRETSIVAYNREDVVAQRTLMVPISPHPVESVNLKDPSLGIYAQLEEMLAREGVTKGRVHLKLSSSEEHAGLTINEFEPLLMRHDLAEVLRNPFRFVAQKGRNMVREPWTIPQKTLDYARYDMIRVFNELFDALRLGQSRLETTMARIFAVPARRFLRVKRSVSLLVSDPDSSGRGALVGGRYQSPILLQWRGASGQQRRIEATLTRLR
jgi:thiamine phosphate synthase YjbQ (UPF0047 family)